MRLRSGIGSFVCCIPFFLVLSTVFVVVPELENGAVLGKYFWFYLSMIFAAIASAGIVLTSSNQKTFRIDAADGLVLLYGIVALFTSWALHHSEAVTKHILLAGIILLYFYFKILLRSHKQALYWVVLFFLATGLVESWWGLLQLYGFERSQHGRFRLTGSFFNPGPYACYIAMVLPCAFYYILRHLSCISVRFRLRYGLLYVRWGIALLTFTGALLVLPAAMSRASWLAGLGGCGWVGVHYLFRNGKVSTLYYRYKRRCLVGMACLFVLAILGVVGIYHLKKDSADGRLLMWKVSLQTFVHHPAGVGIGRFPGIYGDEQAVYLASDRATEREAYVGGNPEYGFNEYLQIGIEQGWVSLLLFLGLIGYSLYTGVRQRRLGATASLLSLLIAALASYPFSVLPFLIGMSFLLAWIHAGKESTKSPTLSHPVLSGLVLCCLLLSLVCLYNRYPVGQAYKTWSRNKALYHSGAYEAAGKGYAPLYPLLSDQLPFLFEYAQCLSKTEHYKESNEALGKAVRISCDPMLYNIMGKNHQAMKQYAEAEQCFRKAAAIVPNRLYPWYLLTKLYIETGETEKAMAAAKLVMEKEPKVHSTAIREMRQEIEKLHIIDTP